MRNKENINRCLAAHRYDDSRGTKHRKEYEDSL